MEKISDRCIIEFKFVVEHKKNEPHLRFSPARPFERPAWLQNPRWYKLFSEAFDLCEFQNWAEACYQVEHHENWDENDDLEQTMVDYTWTLTCAQITCAFRMVFFLAVLEVPDDYDSFHELTRAQNIINGKGIRGVQVKKQTGVMPTKGNRQSLHLAKQCKKIGRLTELLAKLKRNKKDRETLNLKRKLYGKRQINLSTVSKDLEELTKTFTIKTIKMK